MGPPQCLTGFRTTSLRLLETSSEQVLTLIIVDIKVWMLTGDKMETAENIAKSCNLIQDGFALIRYESQAPENITNYLRQKCKEAEGH